jgi:hypothetical protein
MGATSNVVERGNRRYRKIQKMVYRVRTLPRIESRLALDLLGEGHAHCTADQDYAQCQSGAIRFPIFLATASQIPLFIPPFRLSPMAPFLPP